MENREQYLEHILKHLPHKPGVYKMKNAEGQIIYVGKAVDLKHRVSSYFQHKTDQPVRTRKMVEQIADIEYLEVGNELESLILETNLIKELRPKYNVLMKDDKNYIYIKITLQEPYPRIYLVRKVQKDRAKYIGPKTAAHKVIKTLKVLKRVFPFRNCSMAIDYGVYGENKKSMLMTEANLRYHTKHCIGPCITSVSPEEYRKVIMKVIEFLEGKHDEIIEQIKEDMLKAAADKKFEIAAAIRDKLKAVEDIIEPQRISDPHQKDLDIINYAEQDEKIYFNLFQLRNGKLIDNENFIFKSVEKGDGEDRDALSAFLEQYYEKATDLPKEVLVPHEIDDRETLEKWLAHMKGEKVGIIVPERGKKNHLLDLSRQNAVSFARQSQVKWQGAEKGNREKALEELKELLKLPKIPNRLECYDISHFGGTETVSSMTVFEKGFPKKEDYRKFKLHQQESGSPNDFASMEETLTRRLKYLKASKASADFKIKKATKKELKAIYQQIGMSTPVPLKPPTEQKPGENLTQKTPESVSHFFTIEKGQKNIGFIHVSLTPGKRHLIESVQTDGELDISYLVKKVIEKTRAKRIYYRCPDPQVQPFEEAGFQHIQKLPEEFAPVEGTTYLAFDKTKYADDKSFKKTPDLIVIDGGRGQLSSSMKAMAKYDLKIPMISLAKKEEEIYLPGNPNPIRLEKSDPVSLLIQHIRNEAHRFAVSYHQNLRLKATVGSILDTIPGIGPELKSKLLQAFGSPEGVKNATLHEIAGVVGQKNAIKIKEKLG